MIQTESDPLRVAVPPCDPPVPRLVWRGMTAQSLHQLRTLTAAGLLVTGIAWGCADESSPSGLGTPAITASLDPIQGTGALSELQQRRAAWVARGIVDYRFQMRITCFCGDQITRPVLVEVRGGAVAKVWDLETAKQVASVAPYRTITALFDAAIAERSRGGFVAVTYDRASGIPANLEIGTLANDAGTGYQLGGLTPL
jgi:hypothetical protein